MNYPSLPEHDFCISGNTRTLPEPNQITRGYPKYEFSRNFHKTFPFAIHEWKHNITMHVHTTLKIKNQTSSFKDFPSKLKYRLSQQLGYGSFATNWLNIFGYSLYEKESL